MTHRCHRPILTLLPAVGALALATLAVPATLSAQSGIGLEPGSVPEPVTIEDLDGNAVDLGRFIGEKPVLFQFWATWCPLCEELEPRIEAAHAKYGDRVEFIQVAVGVNQSPRSIRRHLEDHPAPARVLWDGRGRATRAFEAPTTSYIVVLDADGRVVYTGAGADQDIEAAVARAVGETSDAR